VVAKRRDAQGRISAGPTWESIVERQIREAMEEGRFDELPYHGEPLPVEHGFPVRLVVPGLYGYVSATKWVVDLEVSRFEDFTAYWTGRGWAARGPVKTQSRIDVPRGGADVAAELDAKRAIRQGSRLAAIL